jgi:hypothetical protein
MRPLQKRSLHSSAARKLDHLEVVAALLERDAINGRALRAEIGANLGRLPQARKPRWQRSRRLAQRWGAVFGQGVALVLAVARSRRLRAAIHATCGFLIDFAMVFAVGCVGLAVLGLIFLLAAPPV